jgi:hypothetical protein
VIVHILSLVWQRLLAAFLGAIAGSAVSYLKLRSLMLLKHEQMKLHVTRTVQKEKESQ